MRVSHVALAAALLACSCRAPHPETQWDSRVDAACCPYPEHDPRDYNWPYSHLQYSEVVPDVMGSFVPMTERVIPGKDGGAGATVIAPARTLCKLFNRIATCNYGQRWPDDTVVRSVQDLFKRDGYVVTVGPEPGYVVDDPNKPFLNMDELEEQYANLQDLMSELGQYYTINGGSEVETPDPPEGWEDEDDEE